MTYWTAFKEFLTRNALWVEFTTFLIGVVVGGIFF